MIEADRSGGVGGADSSGGGGGGGGGGAGDGGGNGSLKLKSWLAKSEKAATKSNPSGKVGVAYPRIKFRIAEL